MGTTTDRNDPRLEQVDPVTGMQEVYLVLPENERVRAAYPVYDTYIHLVCGTRTKMGKALSETYAKNPKFYSATYCVTCSGHYPVGVNGQFVWVDKHGNRTDLKVGSTPEEMEAWRERRAEEATASGDGDEQARPERLGADADSQGAHEAGANHEEPQRRVGSRRASASDRVPQGDLQVRKEVPEA